MKRKILISENELVSLIKRTIMENEFKYDPNEYGCYKLPMGSEIKDWCDSSAKYIANNVRPIKKIISNVQDELKKEENAHLKHNLKFFDKNDLFFSQNLENLKKLKELTEYCNSGKKAIAAFEETIPSKVIFVKKIGEIYEYSLLNKLNTNFSALAYLLTQYKLKNNLMSQPTLEVFKKYFLGGEFYKTLMNYFGDSEYEVNLFKEVFNTITNTTKKGRETELKVIEILNKNFGKENVKDFAGDFSFVDMLGVDVLIYMKDLKKWVPVQIKTKIENCEGNDRFCENICISKTENGQWVVMKYVGEQPVKKFQIK